MAQMPPVTLQLTIGRLDAVTAVDQLRTAAENHRNAAAHSSVARELDMATAANIIAESCDRVADALKNALAIDAQG